jgi:hypothetical protein
MAWNEVLSRAAARGAILRIALQPGDADSSRGAAAARDARSRSAPIARRSSTQASPAR